MRGLIYFYILYVFALILGYLQSQQMDQIALNFAKESPLLLEDYKMLKLGFNVKNLYTTRTLQRVVKDYIEIEEIGMYKIEFKAAKWR